MEQAEPGDIVALASGGPDLTVLKLHRGIVLDGPRKGQEVIAEVDLGWFTAVGEYRTGTLPPEVLVLRRKAGRLEYTRPPRTGYRDASGVYHPAPGTEGFETHAQGCQSCARDVGCTPDGNGKLRPSGLAGAVLDPGR